MRQIEHGETHFDRGIVIRRALWTGAFAILITTLTLSFHDIVAQTTPNKADSETLPEAPGKTVIIRACLPCHNVKVTTARRDTGSAEEWTQVVDKMMSQGAELSDDDVDLVVKYLTTYYGPKGPKSKNAAPVNAAASTHSADKATAAANVPLTALLHVNKAGAEELMSSLKLSNDQAEAIIHYREQHGNFKNWQELAAVPGVPMEKIKSNQEHLAF